MANNVNLRDALTLATAEMKTTEDAGVHTPHHIVDALPPVSLTEETTKIIGTVNIAAGQTIAVTGTFWQATQPVSGPLTDTQLRATPVPVSATTLPALHITSFPAQHIDAFSRVRTSDPGYRFDSQFTYQIDSDLWDIKETGDGDVSPDGTNRLAVLTAGATAGANTAVLQTHYHAPYTPGRGQLAFITFSMPGTVPTNGERGVGYYDGSNGIYLKETASGLTLNVTSTTSATDQSVAQGDWNIDPLDGNGPSGILLDTSNTNIIVIQLQALYVGRVVVGFDVGGSLIPVHSFEHANILTEPYMAQASLPVRYWANTSTDATSCVVDAICCSVISEGGDDLQDIPGRQFVSKATNLDVDTPAEAILVVQVKSQLNSLNQNAVVIPTELDISVAAAGCWIEVRRNVTVTAGDFTAVSARSVCEECFVGNAGADPVVTAGTGDLIDTFYVPATASVRGSKSQGLAGKVVLAYSHLLATADNIAILALDGANSEVRVALKWKEIR